MSPSRCEFFEEIWDIAERFSPIFGSSISHWVIWTSENGRKAPARFPNIVEEALREGLKDRKNEYN